MKTQLPLLTLASVLALAATPAWSQMQSQDFGQGQAPGQGQAAGQGQGSGQGTAHAGVQIHPYLEVQQVFDADLSGGDHNTAAYTGVGAGIDISVNDRNLQGQLDYRYDHFFSWSHRYRDGDTHNGLASGVYTIAPGVTVQAAGIATRTRGSLNATSPGVFAGDFDNTQQVYGVEAGPSVARKVGPFSVSADYRFGFTKVDDGFNTIDLGAGQPRLDNNFTSTSHNIDASIGMPTGDGTLPFGWTATGGYVRDNINFLGAHYDGYFGRLDVVVPVTPTLALVGGAGYEKNKTSEDQILTDAAGNAVLTGKRRLQSDPSKPRLLIYDEDGLIWDVGVLWRPSERLKLEVRGGRRYGETAVTGNLNWQVGRTETVQVVAYNDITSFGRQLTGGIDSLPTSFGSPNSLIPIGIGGCVFGANGGSGACLPALSSVNSNFYRSRGVYALVSAVRGPMTYGLGVNYDHRRYLAADFGAATDGVDFAGVHDDVVTVNGVAARRLSEKSTVTGTAYVAWYDTSLLNSRSYTTYGLIGAYTRLITPRLSGEAAISVYSGSGAGDRTNVGTRFDQDTIGTALLAIRYVL
jgi:hypothetical protein